MVPFYVLPSFLYILFIGIRSLNSQTFSVYKLFVPVLVFGLLRLVGAKFELIDLIFMAFGILISQATFDFKNIFFDKKLGTVTISGSRFLLIFLLLYFCCKFFIGYKLATLKILEHKNNFIFLNNSISSFFAGIMQGRALFIYRAYYLSR